MRTGYLGPPGTFSEKALALLKHPVTQKVWYRSFQDIVKALLKGDIESALFPLENSISGKVVEVDDLLTTLKNKLILLEEVFLPITPGLFSYTARNLEEVKVVLSRPELWEQCREYFQGKPGLKFLPALSSSQAAFKAKKIKGAAFIADLEYRQKARVLGLLVNDHRPSITRFGLFKIM
ncbi:prephenate dehydratase domain-containing protein [Carboxydothermus pertinax]|uniref:prephenate dehydratase n=1 Tax=Carboxydothermus pertinax TaxID=870242 RepID=A0A1L8CUL6_9THEO|nr:prephenate dehydratase domain-containing protein [Carboxydothermus pertinax]GAV22592.1 prephenate dehydratase domain protein [Carboxydothermus pertinax]